MAKGVGVVKKVTMSRQQLNPPRVGRPGSANDHVLLFPVLVKDPKTLEKSEVPSFPIAELGCSVGMCAVSARGLLMARVSLSCFSHKVADWRQEQGFTSSG